MEEKLLGKCGYYCGACSTYIKDGCRGCEEVEDIENRDLHLLVGGGFANEFEYC